MVTSSPSIKEVTPKQLARAIGVSESSVKRWCDRGMLPTVRTAGGHRRLPIDGILRFLRKTGHDVVKPEILGLPALSQAGPRSLKRAVDLLEKALVAADRVATRRIIFELYFAKHPLSTIFDEVVAPTFERIGDRWECNQLDVFQERHGCEIITGVLHELRQSMPKPTSRLRAIGATPEGDHYGLPTKMVELVLRDIGWNANSLGNSVPFDSMIKAVRRIRPQIFWLSCSHIGAVENFAEGVEELQRAIAKVSGRLVAGGRALNEAVRAELGETSYCDNMRQLAEFAKQAMQSDDQDSRVAASADEQSHNSNSVESEL